MKKSWIIRVKYYLTSEQKGVDKKTRGYASENDARLEANHFRHALESSSRTKSLSWKPFIKRSNEETIELLSKMKQCIASMLSVARSGQSMELER